LRDAFVAGHRELVERLRQLDSEAALGRSLLAALETVETTDELRIYRSIEPLLGLAVDIASYRQKPDRQNDATLALAAELQRVKG
jgi:hypothetical protein